MLRVSVGSSSIQSEWFVLFEFPAHGKILKINNRCKLLDYYKVIWRKITTSALLLFVWQVKSITTLVIIKLYAIGEISHNLCYANEGMVWMKDFCE